jgi:hypothetical protein
MVVKCVLTKPRWPMRRVRGVKVNMTFPWRGGKGEKRKSIFVRERIIEKGES